MIAILASYAALTIILWMRLRARPEYSTQILASTVMGMAIVGMHYTGMMAAQFPANSMRAVVEAQYTVARTAGDEFVVVLEQLAPEDAAVIAEKIISTVKQPVVIGERELIATASVGIAISFISGNTYEDPSLHTGAALQHVKQTGKRRLSLL